MTLLLTLLLFFQSTDALIKSIEPRNVGPAIMGGRIDDFAVPEGNPDTIYVGAASGGVWKTVNGGTTWTPIFDDYGTTSIGDIAVAPSNPNILWVGTGEANNRQSSSWGNGIYKSTDAGKTFQKMGLDDTHHIGRIVIDPRNPDIVYVAALGHLWGPNKERGLFKTTDGGRTWTNTKFINEDTGFVDVAMDPSDNNVLYAAAYQRRRTPFGFNGGGAGSGLYKTTDAGKNWTKLTNGFPAAGEVGRIGIDIYRKNPKIVYVTFEHREAGGIYRTDDEGKTWKKINSLNPRPLYFSQIRIDPQDENRIYLLGVSLYVSDDAGKTFRSDGARNVHVDHHAMWIDPRNPNFVVLGNDGGVWFSRDRSRTWMRINNIPLGQFYGIAYDMRDPYWLYGGLQDNAVWGGPSATRNRLGPLNDEWIQIGGGDGMLAAVDPDDYRNVYVETQDGSLIRFDPDAREIKRIRPPAPEGEGGGGGGPGGGGPGGGGGGGGGGQTLPSTMRFNWTTPLVISPHNPATIYLAGNKLWRSLDRGQRWQAISPDLTKQIDRSKIAIMGATGQNVLAANDGVSSYGNATSMMESPIQPGLLAVGTDDGNIQISRDGGVNWINLTSKFNGVPENTWVSRIELSRFDPRRMYVTFDGHRADDFNAYVFVSNDGGETWQAINRGLPKVSVRTLREDLRNQNLLFAGTESGLFVSVDRGSSWTRFKNGMSDAPVFDIQIHPRDRDLLLGTHGRSIYAANIASLEDMTETTLSAQSFLFTPTATTAFNRLEHRDFIAQATYVGANPPSGATVDYYLRDASADAKITIEDRDGQLVQEIKGPAAPGINRVTWDLRYAAPPQGPRQQQTQEGVDPGDARPAESSFARVRGDTGGGGDPTGGEAGGVQAPPSGPMVFPGEYVVKLSANGSEKRTVLTVKPDPRVSISSEDRRKQSDIVLGVYRIQKDANPVSIKATDLNTQMTAITKALGAIKDLSPDVKKAGDDAAKLIRDIQGRISRPLGQLGNVARDVAGSTTPPTEAQMSQFRSASDSLKQALPQFADLEKLIPEFNGKLDQAGIATTVPRLKLNQ